MSEKRYIHIRNWDRFQHYKKRGGVTWIKDYVGQLSDDDWLALTFAQRGILQGLRLLYAPRAPLGIDQAIARTTLCTNQGDSSHFARNLEALNHAGLILLSSSKTLAVVPNSASPEVETEREVEVEQEKDQPLPKPKPSLEHTETNGSGTGQGTEQHLQPLDQILPEVLRSIA